MIDLRGNYSRKFQCTLSSNFNQTDLDLQIYRNVGRSSRKTQIEALTHVLVNYLITLLRFLTYRK